MKKSISLFLAAVLLVMLSLIPVHAENDYVLIGDVDLDDAITVLDATRIQRTLARLTGLSLLERYLGDVNGDTDLSITDATLIQRRLARIDAPFCADTLTKWKAKIDEITWNADETVVLNTAVTFTVQTDSRPIPETFRYMIDSVRMADGVEDNHFTYTFTTPGVHSFTAIARDPFGGNSAKTVRVLAIDPAAPRPTVHAAADSSSRSVSVTASGGTAPYLYRYIIRRVDPLAPGENNPQSYQFVYRADENGEYYLLLDFCPDSEIQLPTGSLSPRLSYQMEITVLDARGGLSQTVTIPVTYM